VHGGVTMGGPSINQYPTSVNNDEEDRTQRQNLLASDDQNVFITHIAGTIDPNERERLKKLLFRATRGKALTYFADYNVTNQQGLVTIKSAYIVVF